MKRHLADPAVGRAAPGRGLRSAGGLRTHVPSLGLFALCAVVTAGVFLFLHARGRDREHTAFDSDALRIAASWRSRLELPLEVVAATAALFESSHDVTREEFDRFAAPALVRHPAIRALEWIPIVTSSERARFEATARADGLAGFEFRDQRPDGSMVRSADRPEHLPIYFMVPPHPMVLGFDVASEEDRRSPVDLARRTGRAVASQRIRLIEDPPAVYSVAVFQPVQGTGADGATRVRGFATEVFRVPTVAAHAIRESAKRNIDVALLDPAAPRDKQVLYESRRGQATRPTRGAPRVSTELPCADRRYRLVLTAGQGYGSGLEDPPWLVLVAGLSLGAFLAGVLSATRVIRRLHGQVQAAQQLGQYTLLEKLGEGGMGIVYRARHAMLRRPTAIKLLSGTANDPVRLARFEREVQLTSQLTHPNTIAVYDYGRTPEGVFYYAMELIDGITLEDLVRAEGPLAPGRVVRILIQACGALAEAHDLGLVHRDIKPANLILTNRGGIADLLKVLDFGLVKDESRPHAQASLSHASTLLGTPLYLSPESIRGEKIDGRTDLYALGAVAYFLVSGVTVFEGQTVIELCAHHLQTPPVPPSQRTGVSVPAALEEVILHCLAKRPEDRPASARVLAEKLRSIRAVVGAYSDEDARRFWRERGRNLIATLRDERNRKWQSTVDMSHAATIAVDLRRS